MILDLMIWAPDREAFIAGMLANNMMVEGEDGPVAAPDVAIDEIGSLMLAPPIFDEEGNVTTPATFVEGFHANLRVYGALAEHSTAGLNQYDNEGNLLGIFERTHLLQLVPGLVWEPITEQGVPAGYVGPHGVRLYDPASVATPARVWA